MKPCLKESRGPVGGEDSLGGLLCDTVRKGEFEALLKDLLDVWPPNIVELLDLNDLKDLHSTDVRLFSSNGSVRSAIREWIGNEPGA